MALHSGLSAQRRGIALIALPLAAAIGACTGCAPSSPQAQEAVSDPVPATSSSISPPKATPQPRQFASQLPRSAICFFPAQHHRSNQGAQQYSC
ncbi:hypothetical protein ACTXML_00185 [Glutamicibacter arilaitensis]|uniref:hypothetical protein n=1 Tax=Glutamicibacter arilaitensis TaxID=256701 RepID=UPI003FD287A0